MMITGPDGQSCSGYGCGVQADANEANAVAQYNLEEFYAYLISQEPANLASAAYERSTASRHISPFDPIDLALSGAVGLTTSPAVIASNAGKVLAEGGEAASNAGRILPGTGALAQVFEGTPEALTAVGGVAEAFQDIRQGHGAGYALGDAAVTVGGGVVGGEIGEGFGSVACGSETLITDGAGVGACGFIIAGFSAIGSFVGHATWSYFF
jgi:hypothetical protein